MPKLIPGIAAHSYALHVAEYAGLPSAVLSLCRKFDEDEKQDIGSQAKSSAP
jgi:DNA mismatch repair ATPase MutS